MAQRHWTVFKEARDVSLLYKTGRNSGITPPGFSSDMYNIHCIYSNFILFKIFFLFGGLERWL